MENEPAVEIPKKESLKEVEALEEQLD